MAKAAAALLPDLLPTPPRSTVAPCLIILPPSFVSKPKPGRADSVERWDAHKSPASSCGSSSPERASSCERWDTNKKIPGSSSSSSTSYSSSSSRGSSSTLCEKWDSKRRPPSRVSSTDRWDTHKKARSAQSRTSEQEQEKRDFNNKQPHMDPVFSGSSFFASPEPIMLPMPIFFRSLMSVPAH